MDPRTNPYAPGAGTKPPQLVGREQIMEKADVCIARSRTGLATRSLIMVGLRGVGKTVLLNYLSRKAESQGVLAINIEVPEEKSLPALLIPALRTALLKLDRLASAGDLTKRALRVLGGFLGAMKLKYDDVELSIDLGNEAGVADSGDLEHDLCELLVEVGRATQEKKTALALFIDELQYIKESEFASLITALHRCNQQNLPIIMIGAGMPQIVGNAGRAKSYAERLFEYPQLGPLSENDSHRALQLPAQSFGVEFSSDALHQVYLQTQGYPYFLQEWGKNCWDIASESPISAQVVQEATVIVISSLDESFFRVRFDRLTPTEKRYLRAMAELGEGPHRSGDIARLMKREVQSIAPIRASLIKKGMIFSKAHGDNNFTVPLFDGFMKRVMPVLE